MKRSYSILLPAAVSMAVFFSTSCGPGGAAANVNRDGRPSVLRYCFSSTSEEPADAEQRLDRIKAYLERTLHMPVEVTKTAGSYGAVIEAFRADKIDLASISPFSYVIAMQKIPIEAIVTRGKKDGSPGDYTGVLAVPGSSPIHTVDDLIRHSKELTISYVDPASTSGFLVESAFLQSRGLDPQRDFKKVVFSMNHMASLMTLKAGKVDVVAVMERLVHSYEKSGKLAPGDVRILWVSPPLPIQPVAVRKSLPAAFKEELRQAFVDMAGKDPET